MLRLLKRLYLAILGEPGAVSRVGREGGTKFSSTGRRALGNDSHQTISKRVNESWLLIGHKKCYLCIIVPNRRTASPLFVNVRRAFPPDQTDYTWVSEDDISAVSEAI